MQVEAAAVAGGGVHGGCCATMRGKYRAVWGSCR